MSNDSIRLVLFKVSDMLNAFPFEQGVYHIRNTVNADNYTNYPQFTDNDIKILRRLIYTGVVRDKRLRPGIGFETLSMAVMLKNMVEKAMVDQDERHEIEMVEMMAEFFRKKIAHFKGDVSKAKQHVKTIWGNYPMDGRIKRIFNQAYKLATNEKETTA